MFYIARKGQYKTFITMKTSKTHLILGQERTAQDYSVNYWFSTLISFFTIIFSLSIVFELKDSVTPIMFYVLSIFLGLFLVFNEYLKVKELINFFTNEKVNLFILLITFVISIGLSLIGMYFWVNKSYDTELKSNTNQMRISDSLNTQLRTKMLQIESSYSLENNSNYRQEYSTSQFQKRQLKSVWKEVDRKPILERIETIDNNIRQIIKDNEQRKLSAINNLKADYKLKIENELKLANIISKKGQRNNIITYILLCLTLLNDFVAIMGARYVGEKLVKRNAFLSSEMVVKYLSLRKFLKTFLMKKEVGDKLYITEISKLNPQWAWEDTSMLFGILDSTKIIEVVEKSKGIVKLDRLQALKAFDQYFNEYFEI